MKNNSKMKNIVGSIKGIGNQHKKSRADSKKPVGKESTKAKPDYLDFDKDGNKNEPMKKALKDKEKAMKENTINFIKHVANNNYKKADGALAAIVNEKIKQRIAVANQNLSIQRGNK